MSIFGPLSFATWVYATMYWLLFGVEPGYGGYDSYGRKINRKQKKMMIDGKLPNGINSMKKVTFDCMSGMDDMSMMRHGANGNHMIPHGNGKAKIDIPMA